MDLSVARGRLRDGQETGRPAPPRHLASTSPAANCWLAGVTQIPLAEGALAGRPGGPVCRGRADGLHPRRRAPAPAQRPHVGVRGERPLPLLVGVASVLVGVGSWGSCRRPRDLVALEAAMAV